MSVYLYIPRRFPRTRFRRPTGKRTSYRTGREALAVDRQHLWLDRTEQSIAEQNRTEQNRKEQNTPKPIRAKHSRTTQNDSYRKQTGFEASQTDMIFISDLVILIFYLQIH